MVEACAFSPDGAVLATASWDDTARLWDGRSGAPRALLEGHTAYILGRAFSPDGALLATASLDETARLWDGRSGNPLATLEGHTSVLGLYACAFSPDGMLLATAGGFQENTARLWDPRGGAPLVQLEGHANPVEACAFSPDGAVLATVSRDETARLWDVRMGRPLGAIPLDAAGQCLALHSASPRLAVGLESGQAILAELEGIRYGPLIVTAVDAGAGPSARCPACGERFAVDQDALGTELTCPTADCGQILKLNSFVVQMTRQSVSIVKEARWPKAPAWWQLWCRG